MVKPVDISRFRKSLTKNIKGISTGFNDPKIWLDTGCYAANYLISGDFKRGVPLEGKLTMFAGDSGAGKSYFVSGNLVKSAQQQGIFPIIIDSENALDEQWLHNLGVKTGDEDLLIIRASMIDQAAKFISDFVKDYKDNYADLHRDERPPILIVIDSLGMMLTPTDQNQFEAGDMKGDMGRKAKQLTALCRNAISSIASERIGLVVTNHTYLSQDMFQPDAVISGGKGLEFASSIIVAMNKMKLKEDSDGNKTSEVHGIRAGFQVRKSRYSKPFEKVEVRIPWDTGMDPNSGLLELFEKKGVLVKTGNKLSYTCNDGTEIKEFRKRFTAEHFEIMMNEFNSKVESLDEEPEFNPETGEIIETSVDEAE